MSNKKDEKYWADRGYLPPQNIEEFVESMGVNYQQLLIKMNLVDTIREHCKKHKISQRKLASMVDGLTQDRISKIFNGHVSHMTVDKLVQILSALDYKLEIKITAPKT